MQMLNTRGGKGVAVGVAASCAGVVNAGAGVSIKGAGCRDVQETIRIAASKSAKGSVGFRAKPP
jgi:hypothetical protein